MKKRNMLSLLLVLAIVFSLAGCGLTGKSEEDSKGEYKTVLTALERFVKDPDDIDALCGFIGGDFYKDEFRKMLDMELDYDIIDMDALVDEMEDVISENSDIKLGSEINVSVVKEEDLGADEIADYQTKLDDAYNTLSTARESFADLQDQVLEALDGMTSEEKAQVDEQFQSEMGMTLDEYLDLLDTYVDVLSAMSDKLEGAKVETARNVTLKYTGDNITTESEEIIFLKIDGEWITSALFDMLGQLDALNDLPI